MPLCRVEAPGFEFSPDPEEIEDEVAEGGTELDSSSFLSVVVLVLGAQDDEVSFGRNIYAETWSASEREIPTDDCRSRLTVDEWLKTNTAQK